MTTYSKYNATTHPIITKEGDWNSAVDTLNELKAFKDSIEAMPNFDETGWTRIMARSQENSLCYYDDGYFVARAKAKGAQDAIEHCSILNIQEYTFGTYEGVAHIIGSDTGEEYPFGFELHHGFPLEGLICFALLDGDYYCWTSYNGEETKEVVSNQDWTSSDLTFKITWSTAQVKFYVNNVLVTTHSAHIPQDPMNFFIEACAYPGGSEGGVFFKNRSLRTVTT